MTKLIYNIITEKNSQCKRDNLKRTTEIIIPGIEDYLDIHGLTKCNKIEFSKLLKNFRETLPYEFSIYTESFGSLFIPKDEIWLIIHNSPNHHCRIELKINHILRNTKIDKLLY